MITFDESSKEFIARNVADLGKAILTVGFASSFFEKMHVIFRIGFPIVGLIFIVWGVIVHATRKGG